MLNRVQADFAHAARVAMLGELTASIAHEVNQPLAAIVANANAGLRWLNRPQPDLAELREATESIVADAQRAADIIRRAMIRMEDALAEKKLSAQMLLQVHDELIFEVPEDEVAATLPVVQRVMQDAPFPAVSLAVPLQVDARAASNWDEAH